MRPPHGGGCPIQEGRSLPHLRMAPPCSLANRHVPALFTGAIPTGHAPRPPPPGRGQSRQLVIRTLVRMQMAKHSWFTDGFCVPGSSRAWNRSIHVTSQGPTLRAPLWRRGWQACGGNGGNRGNRGNRAMRYPQYNRSGQMVVSVSTTSPGGSAGLCCPRSLCPLMVTHG
ncbi:hypothetical protein LX36DRAFT_245640 [Colletotrichum falcatum]|nr:hypothetical protein LX36DRAFT_245640 [Colletotrichum falcatum]